MNDKKDKLIVEYYSGPSRLFEGKGADYMIVKAENGIELYAEMPPKDFEDEVYEPLKNKIIKQAIANHIDPDRLIFPFDNPDEFPNSGS